MNPFRKALAKLALWNYYEGATYSTTRSRLPGALQSARFDAGRATREELQRKSRYFEKNSPLYNRIADIWEQYVGGATVQPASSDPTWNEAAKVSWAEWENICDFHGTQPFQSLVGLWERCRFVDGEVFILLTKGDTGRPRLQTIEAHHVRTPETLLKEEGKSVIDGVKIDANGRRLGYYVAQEGGGYREYSTDVLLHHFEPSRPGQYRGIPVCHAVINLLHDLDDLRLLEMQAAKQAAQTTAVIKTASGELDMAELRRMAATNSATSATGTAGGAQDERAEYVKDVTGASALLLKPGEEAQQWVSQRPSVVTQQYWESLEEDICLGIGFPRVIVYPGSMQGTVYRGAVDSTAAFIRARFAPTAGIIQRIYSFWSGIERFTDPRLRNAPVDYWRCSVQQPRSINVDVGRNSAAMLAELEACATDYEAVYGPLGNDWRAKFRAIKEQRDYAASIGLTLPGMTQSAPNQGGQNVG